MCLEKVREQLLAMMNMEREIGHLNSAMQHVETMAAGVQAEEVGSEVSKCAMGNHGNYRSLLCC